MLVLIDQTGLDAIAHDIIWKKQKIQNKMLHPVVSAFNLIWTEDNNLFIKPHLHHHQYIIGE